MPTNAEIMMACIKSAVFENNAANHIVDNVNTEQWEDVYSLSANHDVSNVIAYFLSQNSCIADENVKQKYNNQAFTAMYRSSTQDYELEQIRKVFNKNNIPFVVLKGSNIRKLYPKEWLRTSCDIDVLVKKEHINKATQILEQELNYSTEKENYHDISLWSPSKIHLELHFSILEKKENVDAVLKDAWKYAKKINIEKSEYSFTPEFFIFHIIAHLYYHFVSGGCGVRSVIDLSLILKKIEYNKDELNDLLSTAGILIFFQKVVLLSEIWFGEKQHNEKSRIFEKYILQGGVYGTIYNMAMSQQSKQGKLISTLHRIFLPYLSLCRRFDKEKISKYKIPYYQVLRWILLLKEGSAKKGIEEIKMRMGTSSSDIENIKKLLNDLEI